MSRDEAAAPSFDALLSQIQNGPVVERAEIWGAVAGKGKAGKRILFVDDSQDVIAQFADLERLYATEAPSLPCEMVFFRMGDRNGARRGDFISWLRAQKPFDVIYLDGHLGGEGSGTQLAEEIRNDEGWAYQPIALFTAQASFLTERSKIPQSDGLRVIAKFAATGKEAILGLVIDADDVIAQARERFWHDTRLEVAYRLDEGAPVRAVAEYFGRRLETYWAVEGWYLREWQPEGLGAIAMNDKFGLGVCTLLKDTPTFEKELLRPTGQKAARPWVRIARLSRDQVSERPEMEGYRVMAARLGSRVAGGMTALFTAYRPPASHEFDDADASGLHHVAVLLRLALSGEHTSGRLSELSQVISKVLDASSSNEICALVSDFLQEQINSPLEQQGIKTKTTVRLFHRGSGELHRYGDEYRVLRGNLGETSGDAVSFSLNCVYTHVIRQKQSLSSDTPGAKAKPFLKTTEGIGSYLTVPLRHGGAVIGAINLEATLPNAYVDQRELPLVEALAGASAAAIFNVRAQRFMKELSQMAYRAITLPTEEQRTIESFLNEAAAILYRLTGYSEMLVFIGDQKLKSAWTLVQGWQGNGRDAERIDANRLSSAARNVASEWEKTYLKKALDSDDERNEIYHGQGNEGTRHTSPGDLRPEGRETEHNIVMLLGEKGAHRRAIMLTFEHPSPLPEQFDPILLDFSRLVDKVYEATLLGEDFRTFLRRQTTEALTAQVLSTARHAIGSHLASIANVATKPADLGTDPMLALAEIQRRVISAQREFDRTRSMMRIPKPESCDLRQIWCDIVAEYGDHRMSPELTIEAGDRPLVVVSDPAIIKFILFHLFDNALEHGRANGATRVVFQAQNNGCAVCDNGKALPEEIDARMFELGATRRAMGGGHGLYMAAAQARILGGKLSFVRRDELNCFVLQLGGLA